MTDDGLTPDKLAQAIARLEAEKARRAAEKPAAPTAPTIVERRVVGPETNTIISNPPAPQAKPRKAKKPPAARLTPTYFTIQTAKPVNGDCGAIAEAWFVVKGKELALCDAAGDPIGDWRPIEERGALFTARQALRQRLAARRGPGPDHRPIQYRKTGWM